MVRDTRTHIGESDVDGLAPVEVTKEEFARRLYRRLNDRGWNQADLTRRAGISRDMASKYLNAKNLPTPRNLKKIADALGCEPVDLLPNHEKRAIGADSPSLEFKVSAGATDRGWLKVNRLVLTSTATGVMQLLSGDGLITKRSTK